MSAQTGTMSSEQPPVLQLQRTVSINQPGKTLKVTFSSDDMQTLMGGSPKLGGSYKLWLTCCLTVSMFRIDSSWAWCLLGLSTSVEGVRYSSWSGVSYLCTPCRPGTRLLYLSTSIQQLYVPLAAAKKAAWRSKVLQDLQEETHFSSTELEVLLHHFQVRQQMLILLCWFQEPQRYNCCGC